MSRRAEVAALLVALLAACWPEPARACVGRAIVLGVTGARDDAVVAALVTVLVTERTGTAVEVRTLSDPGAVLDAARRRDVGVVLESTAHALEALGEAPRGNPVEAAAVVRAGFRERFGLVWLEPLGGAGSGLALVLTDDAMQSFPALPRMLEKLSRALDGAAFAGLTEAVRAGKEPAAVARAWLRDKRLI
jgi:glycine betaine/choline ABC-type transport system substrate-binding protein